MAQQPTLTPDARIAALEAQVAELERWHQILLSVIRAAGYELDAPKPARHLSIVR